ncbi:hypothetical protein QE250_01880 [Chromatiaceae bacterium AAb-1]|nr:hypothetical protein [Chromatiaceae bacterium AAb-1]
MLKQLFAASLCLVGSLSFNAYAAKIYIDTGVDYGANHLPKANGPTTTGWLNQLAFTYNSQSVVQDTDGNGVLSAGDTIVATLGINSAGNNDISQNFFTSLIPGQFGGGATSHNGFGNNWGMTFGSANLTGTWDGSQFVYSSGTIDVYLFDATSDLSDPSSLIRLFSLEILTGGNNSIGQGLEFDGHVTNFGTDSFNGISAGDIFSVETFPGSGDGISFEEYSLLNDPFLVKFFLDTNTDSTTASWLSGGSNTFGIFDGATATIGGQHDGSLVFDVPEPLSISILGAGLLMLAGFSRRRMS